ncbi:MAG: hypothetical protein WC182_00365 [Bacilli bacterium]|jgi:co-chaperonin GroES (HSP10)
MKKRSLLTGLILLPLLLTGCNKNNDTVSIEFSTDIPVAYVGEEYDFSQVLIIEENVNYTLAISYFDYLAEEEKTLTVSDNYYFTPVELFDVTVEVTATKGKASDKKSKTITVAERTDEIDELLASSGFGGWADIGITKEVTTDSTYRKGEDSKSALAVRFQGSNPYISGATLLTLNNFRFLPLWEDQTWENSVLHFWVYNPTDFELEFQLRIMDEYTGMVDLDWGHSLMISQFAAPNAWTEIFFSLHAFGVDHPLFLNEEGTRNDHINVKVHWAGAPATADEIYNYNFWVDGVDISPYSAERFPTVDPTNYATAETLEYGWENMILDAGMTTVTPVFDRIFVNSTEEHESKSSMAISFDKKDPSEDGYILVLSPQEEFGEENTPSFRHGTLDFDIHFENVENSEIQILGINDTWTIFAKLNVTPTETSGEWLHVSVDLGQHSDFYNLTKGIRLGFIFKGINDDNKATAKVHIDNIVFDQDGGTPEDQIDVVRGVPFTAGSDLIMDIANIPVATSEFVFDLKFETTDDTGFCLMIGDGWDNYFGYYTVFANGTLGDNYAGVTITALSDGYYRVTMTLSELTAVNGDINAINNINLIFVRGAWTSASGYVEFFPTN